MFPTPIRKPHNLVTVLGSAWSPTDIAGLVAWYDFSDATKLFTDAGTTPVASDGDLVYQANDKSGNGNHCVQATEGARPIYKVNRQNSLSGINLPDVNRGMEKASVATSQPYTMFAVAKSTTAASVKTIFTCRSLGMYLQTNSTKLGIEAGAYLELTGSTSNGTTFIGIGIFNGASSSITANVTAQAGDAGAQNGTFIKIGSAGGTVIGDTYECLIYTSALSAGDIATVRTYLNTKWAVY